MEIGLINVDEIEMDAFAKLEAEFVIGHSTFEVLLAVALIDSFCAENCTAIVHVAFYVVSVTTTCAGCAGLALNRHHICCGINDGAHLLLATHEESCLEKVLLRVRDDGLLGTEAE